MTLQKASVACNLTLLSDPPRLDIVGALRPKLTGDSDIQPHDARTAWILAREDRDRHIRDV
jgi:hypothetical protein